MNKFWNYELNQNAVESKPGLLDNYKMKGKYSEDLVGLFELLGICAHPSLKLPPGKEYTDPNFLCFQHILLDINTCKILLLLLNNSKIISLKFCSNNLELPVLETLVTGLLTKNNIVSTVVYEWNHNIKLENSKEVVSWEHKLEKTDPNYSLISKTHFQIARLATSTKIESLCLRGNYLGDDAMIILIENLKTNNSLRVLNLYNNCISTKSFSQFSTFLETNKRLEEVNLGKNFLVDDDLFLIKKVLGKFLMTLEEVETLQKKMKEKEAIVEKNKKLKNQKKPEEPLPVLDEMIQIGDSFYIIKNNKIRSINLMQNKFTNCYEVIVAILKQTDALFITIDNAVFDKEQRQTLITPSINMNFSTRIYLSK